MRLLILALTMVFSTSVANADIAWQTDRMTPGSVMVLRDSDGAELMHVARGKVDNLKRFDVYLGRGKSALYQGSYLTTADGNVVREIAVDGAVTAYAPHRCNRVVGECRFVVTHSDGVREDRSRVTRVTRGGLEWREFGLDGVMAQGALELDQTGAAKGGWRKKKSSGKVRSKRVMIALN